MPPELSLGTAALIIFLICAGVVLLRGAIRLLVGVLVLCGSAYVGFRAWQLAPNLAVDWFGKPLPWLSTALPVIAFLATFLLARFIVNFVSRPFSKNDGERKPLTLARLIGTAVFTLIPAALLWFTGAALIHHAGSLVEIQEPAKQSPAPDDQGLDSILVRLRESIAAIVPAEWLAYLDPLADPNRLELVKYINTLQGSPPPPRIDPDTGKEYPRAIIVDDPELRALARTGRFDTLIQHPLFQKALTDPHIRETILGHPR